MWKASVLFIIASAAAPPLEDAQLTYKTDQACAAGGQMASLQNNLTNQGIKVTLKISTTISGQTSVGEGRISLTAGGDKLLGCTLEGVAPPYISRKFEIVGVARK